MNTVIHVAIDMLYLFLDRLTSIHMHNNTGIILFIRSNNICLKYANKTVFALMSSAKYQTREVDLSGSTNRVITIFSSLP